MGQELKYPRINCSIRGCKRGSRMYAPGTSIVCGKCWRKAPKGLLDQFKRWRRKARALDRKGSPRAAIAWRRMDRTFWIIVDILNGDRESPPEDMPPLMAEQLRKDGLL